MEQKLARDMSAEERAAELARLIRLNGRPAPPPPVVDPDAPKMARDMSSEERREFLRAHKQRYGL